jgi:DNA-binding FadR family transcriptional regulator
MSPELLFMTPAARADGSEVRMPGTPGSPKRTVMRRESLHHGVAQDIGQRILKGEFAPGALLPNEAECGETYGVSRTAVREAVKMLMAKGLIVSRPKIGSRVQPKENWNLLDRDVLAWYCAATDYWHFLADMQQVRRILEPEAAALAATNHTPSQLGAIEAALAGMREAAADASLTAWNAADVRFHLAILAAAGNDLLVPLGFLIESALGNMFDYTARHARDLRPALKRHEDILAAIRRHRPEAARRAVWQLLNDTNKVIGLRGGGGKRVAGKKKAKGGKRNVRN